MLPDEKIYRQVKKSLSVFFLDNVPTQSKRHRHANRHKQSSILYKNLLKHVRFFFPWEEKERALRSAFREILTNLRVYIFIYNKKIDMPLAY